MPKKPAPRKFTPIPRFTDEQVKRIIDTSPDPIMRCWILLSAYEGMRVIEVASLAREDIGGETLTIRNRGVERVLPLNPLVAQAITEATGTDGPLWDVRPEVVSRKINRHLVGLGIKGTAHGLRHWFGGQMYASLTERPDPAGRLVRRLAMMIPKTIEQRDEAMRAMRGDGATLREIAEAAGMSHQAVDKILKSREL